MSEEKIYHLLAPVADLWDTGRQLDTQMLFGDPYKLVGDSFDQSLMQVCHLRSGKVGLMSRTTHFTLSNHLPFEPTHRVRQPTVPVYEHPDFKSRHVATLPMNSRIIAGADIIETSNGSFVEVLGHRTRGQWWIQTHHLFPIGIYEADFVEVALRFVGRDYLWGAVSANPGIDCSALIMQACLACGIPCPRDSGPQSRGLGKLVQTNFTPQLLQRGDLVFWTEGKGRHVALMVDGSHAVHATIAPPHSGVVVQPLAEIVRQQESGGNGRPTAVRRLPEYRLPN